MAAFDYADPAVLTPLLRAVLKCDKEEVRRSLDEGFSPNLQDNRGWTPIHEAAILCARSDCLNELLTMPSGNINNQTFHGETALFLACEHNNVTAVELILNQSKCNVNLPNSEGVTPLHIASNKKNLIIVRILVEFGAKVNIQDFNGYTPLHETVCSGNCFQESFDETSLEICKYLLKHGANLDVYEYEGNHPFHLACQNGLEKCLIFFHDTSKVDIMNLKNSDGRTPLMMGVQSKNFSVVKRLLSLGANPNSADSKGITALHLAAHSADFDVFNTILKVTNQGIITKYCTFDEVRDLAIILKCKRINSLICLAIDTEDLSFLSKVLKSKLDPAALECPIVHTENVAVKSFTLHTPISFLLESKMFDLGERTVDFLKALIEHKSPLKIVSKEVQINYVNPICACLVSLNDCLKDVVIKCLKILLLHGADPDEPSGRFPFAMEQACMRSCVEAVVILLQYSNVLEPEDVLKWIECETSTVNKVIVETLLRLAPYYKLSNKILLRISESETNVSLLPKVNSLSSYCRYVIRKQLHEETKMTPVSFRNTLQQLELPRDLLLYLSFQ